MAKVRKSKADGTSGDVPELPPGVGGDGPTTGRFIVIFKDGAVGDPAGARAVLRDVAGIGDAAVASDYEDSAVTAEDLAQTEAMYFPTLGMAVVSGDEAVQAMAAGIADADSPILAIEPEYTVSALETSGPVALDYLRGYKAAVDHLYEQLTARGADAGIEEMPAAGFSDTAQFTWGLQATRVNTSRYSGQGVRVAVLDTGLDFQHPDFLGRAIVSRSFIAGQTVQDGQRHGTHCTGTACGPRQPASGVRRYGIAYGATIYIGKVLSNQGSGATAGIIAGIEWAAVNGCQVVSMSLGADIDQKLQQYDVPIQRALNAGTLVIAAASNNARRFQGNVGFVGAPANADAALAVGALDAQLRVADFSPRSSTATGVGGRIDIVGPGVNVFSSLPNAVGKQGFLNGTSMATPHVAGIAALWCQATGARGAALWARVLQSARPLALDSRDVGAGLVQAPQ
ncbi:S8 family serine peptidase [Gemmata sp. JC673]|uniref:S8 family serine peptidase n=1 Tax=Gemmata algarum TaxID=2975278 RepID=A0ABU5EZ80_9BACT|nr:S8 family serine peptidase [Gemmata algarum]MDY3560613.1 S8 family serine peptidase [Gemmata algarum]